MMEKHKGTKMKNISTDNFAYKHINLTGEQCDISCLAQHGKIQNWKFNKPFAVRCLSNQTFTEDPYLVLPQLKFDFQDRLRRIKKGDIPRNCNKFNEKTYFKMQKTYQEDPDKYFSSNYNWYYTGGNIASQCCNNILFLYYSVNATDLHVMKLRFKNSKWKVKEDRLVFNNNDNIYQVCSTISNNIVGIRSKYNISLLEVNKEECNLLGGAKSSTPFVNLSLNNTNTHEYVTIDVTQNVQLWDINTSKSTALMNIPNSSNLHGNCFGQSFYLDNNVIVCINRTGFFIFDKRTDRITNLKGLEIGKDLSCVCVEKSDTKKCYITTTNNIKYFDMTARKTINTWSHHLKDTPFLADSIYCNELDTLSISSSYPDQKLIISPGYFPALYPNLINSYEMSILSNNYQRDISVLTKDRLEARTTGITIAKPEEDDIFTMFVSNSLGDIFAYPVNNSYEELDFLPTNYDYESGAVEVLHVVDRVCLNDLKFDVNSKPVLPKHTRKEDTETCLGKLKKQRYKCTENISVAWTNEDEDNGKMLHLQEDNVKENIERWLYNTSNDSLKDIVG